MIRVMKHGLEHHILPLSAAALEENRHVPFGFMAVEKIAARMGAEGLEER